MELAIFVRNQEISPISTNPDLMLLTDFARKIRRNPSTVRCWVKTGRTNQNTGQVIKLWTRRLPGGLATSYEFYEDFLEALNQEGDPLDEED